jgi:serine/threonine-protein kinase RsbW
MNTMLFNALQMASCLHMRVPGCELIKEATMLEEIKAAQIPDCGKGEVQSTTVKTSSRFVELRNSLPSHVDIVSPFVDQLMRFISRFRVADESNVEIELALREALVNAIVHGNHEDLQKRVYVKCRCMADGEVSITVEDEGQGFTQEAVPDPTSPDNRLRTHGRGIYLMRASMHEVHFEDGGSVVHMRKNPTAEHSAQRRTQ